MAVVALAAAMLSYQSLMHLGELAGYGSLSALYPVVVDAGAAASCATWLHTRGRQPLVMTWGLLAISVVLNGTTHYLESTHTAPSWLLVVAVAAVPPTVLGLCVHLAVGMGGTHLVRPGHAFAGGGRGAGSTTSRYESTSETDVNSCDSTTEVNSRETDPIDELIEQGAGRVRIARELGVSEHQARLLIAERKNGHVPT
jgi:hypothetical protein